MGMMRGTILWALWLLCWSTTLGQTKAVQPVLQDTVLVQKDSLPKLKHNPRTATIRSAIIPGWGQAYNKQYWKIPIVYAAVGIPAYMYYDNRNWYKKTREAARMIGSNPMDTANFRNRVDEKLYIFFTTPGALNALLNYRNEFRKNMDYSVLFTLLLWGLNVVDATVYGHLKDFDISDDLSVKIKPQIMPAGNAAGVSLVFTIGKLKSERKTYTR
jgi:hypothetical protein